MAVIELIGPTGVGKTSLLMQSMEGEQLPLFQISRHSPKYDGPIQFGQFDAMLLSLAHRRICHQHSGNGNVFDFFHRISYCFNKIKWDASIRHKFEQLNAVDDDPVTHLFLLEMITLAKQEHLLSDFLKNRRLVFIYDDPAEILRKNRLRSTTRYRALNGFSDAALFDLVINPYLSAMARMEQFLHTKGMGFDKINLTANNDANKKELKRILERFCAKPSPDVQAIAGTPTP